MAEDYLDDDYNEEPTPEQESGGGPSITDRAGDIQDKAGQLKDRFGKKGAEEAGKEAGEKAAEKGAEKAAEKGAEQGLAAGAGAATGGAGAAAVKGAELASEALEKVGISKKKQCGCGCLAFFAPALIILPIALGFLGLMEQPAIADPIKPPIGGESVTGEYFPVVDYRGDGGEPNNGIIPTSACGCGRYFGAPRKNGKKHAGIDLLDAFGTTTVVAVKDGTVVRFFSDFYAGTDAVMIDHGDYVINYAEIRVSGNLRSVGAAIKAGEVVGTIIDNNASGSSMLHFELYKPGTTVNYQWWGAQPEPLLDGTQFLKDLFKATSNQQLALKTS